MIVPSSVSIRECDPPHQLEASQLLRELEGCICPLEPSPVLATSSTGHAMGNCVKYRATQASADGRRSTGKRRSALVILVRGCRKTPSSSHWLRVWEGHCSKEQQETGIQETVELEWILRKGLEKETVTYLGYHAKVFSYSQE